MIYFYLYIMYRQYFLHILKYIFNPINFQGKLWITAAPYITNCNYLSVWFWDNRENPTNYYRNSSIIKTRRRTAVTAKVSIDVNDDNNQSPSGVGGTLSQAAQIHHDLRPPGKRMPACKFVLFSIERIEVLSLCTFHRPSCIVSAWDQNLVQSQLTGPKRYSMGSMSCENLRLSWVTICCQINFPHFPIAIYLFVLGEFNADTIKH